MDKEGLIRKELRTPRAAAIAGMLFAVLRVTSYLVAWTLVPGNSPVRNVIVHAKAVSLALYLLPFAGIAFLWFMAVVRSRLGDLEDRFFVTVFLGSGLLYIAMTFISGAMASGFIRILLDDPGGLLQRGFYAIGRAEIYQTTDVYGIKMAGVFMFSTSTIMLRTAIVPRWIPILGYGLGAVLLLSIGFTVWVSLVFPLWVFLVSAAILFEKQPEQLDS